MYMHRIENASAKVNDLLAAADYFQMDGLKEMCGRHILDTITPENCLEVSQKAKRDSYETNFGFPSITLASDKSLQIVQNICCICYIFLLNLLKYI